VQPPALDAACAHHGNAAAPGGTNTRKDEGMLQIIEKYWL